MPPLKIILSRLFKLPELLLLFTQSSLTQLLLAVSSISDDSLLKIIFPDPETLEISRGLRIVDGGTILISVRHINFVNSFIFLFISLLFIKKLI